MNRAVLARLVVPATFGGVAFGFWYTVAHGRSPYADLRAWAKGHTADEEQPLKAVTLKLR
ncbi:expressed protein [Chlorella variabilis]|uniref:Expressed protein n=1 Tax=Chlorella variabilis TaxID=554065 RepID=E1ZA59_CHLVA|nr:expressed protein [Chlorella variabilis]EFN57208.1 expressed protein [Chlorella variabilis]|eukprot:XP_005849310.1 expressed protein [Chlorella variabilis]